MKWFYFMLVFVPVNSNYTNFNGTHENTISTPCTDQNHYFLVPGVLTAGSTNRACVSRFHPEGSARMLLTLTAEDAQTYTASRELPPGDGGCLDISVPLLPNTKAEVTVNVWYKEAKCVWEKRIPVRVASGRVVVVHTERARYRPGELMKARVFAVKGDLTPAPWNIEEIWLEGPPGAWEGTRIAEWSKVRSKLGLAQIQHEIDELAPVGKWTIRARLADGSQGSAVFWVGNYELPPFQLTVRHAPKVLRTSERLVWTVCVRYPWSEAVEGMLVIRLRALGGNKSSSGVRTAARVRGRACHRHAAAAGRVGLLAADIVVADFSLQEEGTRIWQNTTVVSQVVDKPIYLEFLTKPTTIISPALPYKLKVKASRWDDKPCPNVRVIVCRSVDDYNKTCVSGDTDVTGVARVMFAAGDDANIGRYTFQAHLSNDTTTTTNPLTLSTRNSTIQAALGPLKADPHSRTFVPLYLSLQNVTKPVTVHFVVITRGGIIYRWGATTQCPIASSAPHIQTATRYTKCDDPMPQYDKNNDNIYEYDNNKNDNNNLLDKNRNNINKDGRSYDHKTNQYTNDKNEESNKISDYIIRNMNEFDINSYLHKNANDKNKVDKNTTIFDRYSSVIVRNHADEKSNDINSVQYEANESDALLDRHLLRIMLPVKVTQQMCPDSHLIAYFYYDGEFVSASKHFEMDDCFVNKVELNFQPRQTLPGSTATLQVSTPGPALCALTAIDVAAKWGTRGVKDVLMEGLRTMIDGHRNMTEFDAAVCTENPQPLNSKQITASWLSAAGVTTGDNIPRNCDSPAPLIDDRTAPRTDFSEAWLWRFVAVGSDGTGSVTATAPDSITRYEANAVCLSKTGIAIAQPAVLQVFREFFIHADCPKRLRRGDSTILRYRIFNYLYEPLSVQVQIITSPHIQGPSELVESICIPPRSPAARRVHLTAKLQGEGSIGVRAKAVTDGGCGNVTARRGVNDEVIMKIVVEPEGMPVQEHKSILLCAKENNKSEVKWKWSQSNAVPGTESLTVWLTGNLIGPLLADSDALVQLPRGCGEQNMARLATNLLALQHLQPHCSAALVARQHVARGFTRQLQYIHPEGGFSAFGASDLMPSTWLTAFSLRYMKKAHKVLWPEQPIPPSLEKAEQWLRDQQMENGCFRNEGQVFHRELRGGLNEEGELASISLTAYVIVSLVDSSTASPVSFSPLSSKLIRNTLSCLRALPPMKHKTPTRVYAHALRAYAFTRLNMYENDLRSMNEAKYDDPTESLKGDILKANEGLLEVLELVKMAKTEGDYMWWETSSLSTSIEATSYALLALTSNSNTVQWGGGAVRWLSAHRAHTGGFLNTQDTLVALEALTAWTSLQPSSADLNVTINSGSITKSARISPRDRIPEIINLGSGDKLDVDVKGTGCALIQATRKYNSLTSGAPESPARPRGGLGVTVTIHPDGTFDCDNVTDTCYCAAVIEVCARWSVEFPQMSLLEVSLAGGYSADAPRLYSLLDAPDTLLRRIELPPSGSRATLYLGSSGAPLPPRGHSCYNVHIMGPRAPTRPAYVKIMDYYDPENNDTQFFTIPEDCPSRVTHESTQDLTSNNIFNKARSLSDDGEVLITQEYTFEDIPDGIPLEDPLYENLRLADVKINKNDTKDATYNSAELLENLYNLKEKSENTNENFKNNSNVHVVNITDFIKEINKKIHKSKLDDKLDFHSSISTSNSSNRSKKIMNSNQEEIAEELTINDKIATKVDSTRSTHENIQESTNIAITTEIPQINDKVPIKDKVDNPNLSDFHVIDSEKDLEVPSGIEGPVPQIVLPPKDFKFQHYNPKEQITNIGLNIPNTDIRDFESTQSFGLGNFDSTHDFVPQETKNIESTQGVAQNLATSQRIAQNLATSSGIPKNFEPFPVFGPTENFRTQNRPKFESNFERNHMQNLRPTSNFRRNYIPSQNLETHIVRNQNISPIENFETTTFKYFPYFGGFANSGTTIRNGDKIFRPNEKRPIADFGYYNNPQKTQNYGSQDNYETFYPEQFRNYQSG